MEFRIADTFTDSLARLTGDEQKAVKTTAFDLQLNSASPGMNFHKLDRARDKNFWSVRVSGDLRIIVHRTETSILLCYVDHHDEAYRWANRRKLETHPKTGAAQLVEVRETVREIRTKSYPAPDLAVAPPKLPLFAGIPEADLLSYGVPKEWIEAVHNADEDSILELADHLPGEASEALLEIATGGKPQFTRAQPVAANPFNHPDALRRFRVMNNIDELASALDYPWDKWTIFLHPSQRELVERDYNGPAKVSGSAGTGKTIVALHRAYFLARTNPEARILLTTFSEILAHALNTKLRRLISHDPRIAERLEVHAIEVIAKRLSDVPKTRTMIAGREKLRQLMHDAAQHTEGQKFSLHFLLAEWDDVVDAWQLNNWEEYRDVRRLGRKTRLPEQQRILLWEIFEKVRSRLNAQHLMTASAMFSRLAARLEASEKKPFDYIVVDEAQDISIAQLRFLAALAPNKPNSLFFAGDLGQRIFQLPFSWKALGIDIRGRSRTLHINYRTSHQIRTQADRLLSTELSDVDGNIEKRSGTISLFNGPAPIIKVLNTPEEEIKLVSTWILERTKEGLMPYEIGIFVRSTAEINRARKAIEATNIPYKVLEEHLETTSGHISIGTMHLAKGLEFRAVAVMACDDEVIPLQERIEKVTDDTDLEEVYNTERHLLYVACTRARDFLLVTGTDPASEFLDDLSQ